METAAEVRARRALLDEIHARNLAEVRAAAAQRKTEWDAQGIPMERTGGGRGSRSERNQGRHAGIEYRSR